MTNDASSRAALAVIETLDDIACRALLGRHRLCTLSLVDGDVPYAVPLFYGFDGTTLYLGLAEGRKTRVLDANPAVCLTVTEIAAGDRWASVQVAGRAEWVEGSEREAALQVLMAHNRRVRASEARLPEGVPEGPDSQGTRRHGGGRILRVSQPVFSGRVRP